MISFSTVRYERSHMTRPRGRGLWLFETSEGKVYEAYGTLSEAKAKAKAEIKATGYSGTVYVMP